MTRINLWASPRNISTAMMYSFAQRSDTQVFDEPLYAHYLRCTAAKHPAAEAVLASQENEGEQVVQAIILGKHPKPVAFYKQMTHHLVQLDRTFLQSCKNVLLIRDPASFISSYAKVISHPQMVDIGIREQWTLCQELQATGKLDAVIDSSYLLQRPKVVLQQLCAQLGISFQESMLSWEAGPRPEDGVWAPHWYANVHASTGFKPYTKKEINIPPHLENLVAEAQIYYQKLLPLAIQ